MSEDDKHSNMKHLNLSVTLVAAILSIWGCENTQKSSHSTPELEVQTKKPQGKYFGLTAKEILSIPDNEILVFCEKKEIELYEFVNNRTSAKTELLQMDIERDSAELVETYKRIDRKLGIPQNE